jgi:hypothetical protein
VLINEIAWAGTLASANDEWIELHNPGPQPTDLDGWRLSDGGDIGFYLSGGIAPFGFFLLERTDDACVTDIVADQLYHGALSDSGEHLRLLDPSGQLIDSANGNGGGWPAGSASSQTSMERRGGDDRSANWGSFTGFNGAGRDASGRPINGSPRAPNLLLFPTPEPTWIPGRIVINEVLIRPHYDWAGTGSVSTADEFIELLNLGRHSANLNG